MPRRTPTLAAIVVCTSAALGCVASSGAVASPPDPPPSMLFVETEPISQVPSAGVNTDCPAQVELSPTTFYGQVSLHLPQGLEGESLTRGLHTATPQRSHAVGCDTGISADGYLLTYNLRDSPTLSSTVGRVFSAFEFPSEREVEIVAGNEQRGDVTMTITFGAGESAWASRRVYLRVLAHDQRMVTLAYVCEQEHWATLERTFAASTASLVLLPQGS